VSVRALAGNAELSPFHELVTETFVRPDDLTTVAAQFRRHHEGAPWAVPESVRGIVEDGEVLGGYFMHERVMRIGPALLPTACIGGVVTRPHHRGRGVARALMDDAIHRARERGLALLLLDGVGNFYHRFGYIDVYDETICRIERVSAAAAMPEAYSVRPACAEDAPELLDLYRRHAGQYGSFDWDVPSFEFRLAFWLEQGRAPLVAVNGDGVVEGYLAPDRDAWTSEELGADTDDALFALLRTAAERVPTEESMRWRLAPQSRAYFALAASVPYVAEMEVFRDAGWMARAADLGALLAALVPALADRWERSHRPWRGTLDLRTEDGQLTGLQLGDTVRAVPPRGGMQVSASVGALAQAVCGYRPMWWLTDGHGIQAPDGITETLSILFPELQFVINGTDAF
jgi:predicted N-acetyltransferase YhbS